jgi:hypothetical protein
MTKTDYSPYSITEPLRVPLLDGTLIGFVVKLSHPDHHTVPIMLTREGWTHRMWLKQEDGKYLMFYEHDPIDTKCDHWMHTCPHLEQMERDILSENLPEENRAA